MFRESLPIPVSGDSHLEEALRHVLDHPGSLIRPRLIVEIAAAFGVEEERATDLAIAIEYFHSASLLFDDLPCMDNALERRGVPCAHRVYGESGAILAALALINRAYALAWRAVAGSTADRQQRALAFIEQCLGVEGLLNGQSMDLHYSQLPQSRETTDAIARGKTVSLIRLTLVLPAMLGDATAREEQQLERMAALWGLSYQVLDDLKDLLQSTEQAGKTVARDVLLGRPNAAVLMGAEAALDRAERLLRAGSRALCRLQATRSQLGGLKSLGNKLDEELAGMLTSCKPLAGACL